jgi:phenylpropionate dioxygenase-like ring-hydroxylating dioxygenase large terminal subunit
MIPNQWYPVLESRRLGKKPVGIERLGERLVAWRSPSGEAVVQQDRCVHKGAQLSLGRVVDGCIACPYHGLRYDASGSCTLVPFMDRDYRIPANWKVKVYPTREACGLLWVWVGKEAPTDELPWFDGLQTDLRRSWETSTIWPYHYTRVMDSNFDVYHFPFVHRSINPGMGPVVVEQEVEDLGDLIKTRATLDDYAHKRKGTRARRTFVLNVRMPCLLYLEMTKRLWLVACVTPVDEERSWVFARYYANMPLGGLVAWMVGRFEYKIVQDQDKRILDTLPQGPLQQGEYIYGKVDAGSILWAKKRAKLRQDAEAAE